MKNTFFNIIIEENIYNYIDVTCNLEAQKI